MESNLNTPLNLNHAVRAGGLNAGTNCLPRTRLNNTSDPDGGGTRTPKKREGERVSFDSIGLLCGASVKVCPPTSLRGPDI